MSLSPKTALHQLRILYRDAHHCEPESDALVLKWAGDNNTLTTWATSQIRYGGWGYQVTAATVANARRLYSRASKATSAGQDPFDALSPTAKTVAKA
jgi:hypothetical protein